MAWEVALALGCLLGTVFGGCLEGLEGFGGFGRFWRVWRVLAGCLEGFEGFGGCLLGKVFGGFGGFWRVWRVLKGVGGFGRFWRVWKVWRVLEGVWRVWKVFGGFWRVLEGVWRVWKVLEGLEGFGAFGVFAGWQTAALKANRKPLLWPWPWGACLRSGLGPGGACWGRCLDGFGGCLEGLEGFGGCLEGLDGFGVLERLERLRAGKRQL